MLDISKLAIEYENKFCHTCKDNELCLNMNDCYTYILYISKFAGRLQYNQY